MSLSNIFQISSQGMTSQRERLETASANLANANTTRTAEGGAYRRRDVIFEAASFQDLSASIDSEDESALPGVRTKLFISEAGNGIKRYQPEHPDADAAGFVTMPDINPLEETVNVLSAARAFEANATVFNTAKELMRATLKLSEA